MFYPHPYQQTYIFSYRRKQPLSIVTQGQAARALTSCASTKVITSSSPIFMIYQVRCHLWTIEASSVEEATRKAREIIARNTKHFISAEVNKSKKIPLAGWFLFGPK